jgi:hypothetical protein
MLIFSYKEKTMTNKKLLLGMLVMVLVFGMTVVGCDINDTTFGTSTWKYEVTGTAKQVDITMSDREGNTVQYSKVDVPWVTSFTLDNVYTYFAYISAQNQGSDGSVTVTIYRNGKSVKSATSEGAFVIATASYYYSD